MSTFDPNKPPILGGGTQPLQQGTNMDQYVAPTVAAQTGMPIVAPVSVTDADLTPPMSTGTPAMSTGMPPQPMTGAPQMPSNMTGPTGINPAAQLPQFQQFGDAAYADATRRLDPQFAQADDRFAQQMVNKGLSPGTEAYNKARANFDMAKNDAYGSARNQALLAGLGAQNQAFGQQMGLGQFAFQGQRADMQDLMALLGYGQNTNANNNQMLNSDFNRAGGLFGLVPGMSPVQVDVMSPYNMQNQQNIANQQAAGAASNGFWGAAGQIGAAAMPFMPFMPSDRRVKTDIERVGTLDNGLPVYLFRYLDGGPLQIGLMAQDVQEVNPEAVRDFDGVLAVDYRKAVAA